jgi:hypothetical protein
MPGVSDGMKYCTKQKDRKRWQPTRAGSRYLHLPPPLAFGRPPAIMAATVLPCTDASVSSAQWAGHRREGLPSIILHALEGVRLGRRPRW